jgi:hypothetical protein
VAAGGELRSDRFHGARGDRREIHDPLLQGQFPACHARDVKKIIDQPYEPADLTVDHAPRLLL